MLAVWGTSPDCLKGNIFYKGYINGQPNWPCELIAQRLPSNKFLFMLEIVSLERGNSKKTHLAQNMRFSVFVSLKAISMVFKWLEN